MSLNSVRYFNFSFNNSLNNLININWFFYDSFNRDFSSSFNYFLNFIRNFNYLINNDFFFDSSFNRDFNDFFKFNFLGNFNNFRNVIRNVSVDWNSNINFYNDFSVNISRYFNFYFFCNFSVSWDLSLNNDFVDDFFNSVRSYHSLVEDFVNNSFSWYWNFSDYFLWNINVDVVRFFYYSLYLNLLFNRNIFLLFLDNFNLYNDFFVDWNFNLSVNVVSVLNDIFSWNFYDDLIWNFFGDFNILGDFLDDLDFSSMRVDLLSLRKSLLSDVSRG